MQLTGTGVWSQQLRYGDPAEIADAAAELETLGYEALWIPDVGGAVFEAVETLLAATDHTVVATGILNLWMHLPAETAEAYARLQARYDERFLLGIGVSHAPLIDSRQPGRYTRPLAATAAFLDDLDRCDPPVPPAGRVLAALGPRMLDLAAARTAGVHPYLVTPEHTAVAREHVGPDSLVLPEQTVILCADRDEARSIGTEWFRQYLKLPNYATNLLRLGFDESDLAAIPDRLFDAVIAWGDEEAIKDRVDQHRAAGADHVCVQVLQADPGPMPRAQWRQLAAALNLG